MLSVQKWGYTISTLLIIGGCGLMSNPKDKELQKIDIPQKISVEIPTALNPDDTQMYQKIKVDKQQGYAQGYMNIVSYIGLIEYVVAEIKSSLLFVDDSMLEIQKACQETPLNKICTIEGGKVFTTMDEDLLTQLRTLLQVEYQTNPNLTLGEQVPFGAIEFEHFDTPYPYDYRLSLDITELHAKIFNYNATDAKVFQVIEWSEDNNSVFSSLSNEIGDTFQKTWTINYQNGTDQERMNLFDTEQDEIPLPQFTNAFTLTKLNDAQHTYRAKYNGINNDYSYGADMRQSYKFSSYTELTDGNGSQRYSSTETYDEDEHLYREDSIFDNLGKLLAVTYCYESDEACSLDDITSWYSDAEDESIFDPIASLPIDFIQLRVIGSDLPKGSYFLLPQDTDISAMSIDAVVSNSVGEFVYAYGTAEGMLYDARYQEALNTLQVVYAKYTNETAIPFTEREGSDLEVIMGAKRPALEVLLP